MNLRRMARNYRQRFAILGLWAQVTERWQWRSGGAQTVAGGQWVVVGGDAVSSVCKGLVFLIFFFFCGC